MRRRKSLGVGGLEAREAVYMYNYITIRNDSQLSQADKKHHLLHSHLTHQMLDYRNPKFPRLFRILCRCLCVKCEVTWEIPCCGSACVEDGVERNVRTKGKLEGGGQLTNDEILPIFWDVFPMMDCYTLSDVSSRVSAPCLYKDGRTVWLSGSSKITEK